MTGDFQNPAADLASLPAAPNLKIELAKTGKAVQL